MTVTCSRCGAVQELTCARKDALCGSCYGSLDEDAEKTDALYEAELKKLQPLSGSYGDTKD